MYMLMVYVRAEISSFYDQGINSEEATINYACYGLTPIGGVDYTYTHSPVVDGENKYGYFAGFPRRLLVGGSCNMENIAPNCQGSRVGLSCYVTAFTSWDFSI